VSKERAYVTPRLRAALEACGLPYEIEPGKRHHIVRLAGQVATILPRGSTRRSESAGRHDINNAKAVERLARKLKEGTT
jgi:hypothetical protein